MRLILALLATASMSTAVVAAPVDLLLQERIESEFGAQMPADGEIELLLPPDAPDAAEYIAEFWMNSANGRILALLVTFDGATQRIEGRMTLTVPVAVPVRNLMPSDVISVRDLEVVKMAYAGLGPFSVTRMSDLVGMEVRRVLRQGRPVMQQSVSAPLAVTRGDSVTIQFSQGRLRLTAPGRALSDALLDGEVRVVNLDSNKTVTGLAIAQGLVEIPN